jgi:CRISPR-associated exonuclease Cas4
MISGLQHFAFCKRQWALVHIGEEWDENYLTASGRRLHSKVDDPYADEIRDGVHMVRSAQLASKRLGIYGISDIIEFPPGESPLIVEYKRGRAKELDCDRLQLAAQVMCYEEMHDVAIERAAIFYGQTRRREIVPITDELRKSVESMFAEMHDLHKKSLIPKPVRTKSCKACSLFDICRPDDKASAKKYIEKLLR